MQKIGEKQATGRNCKKQGGTVKKQGGCQCRRLTGDATQLGMLTNTGIAGNLPFLFWHFLAACVMNHFHLARSFPERLLVDRRVEGSKLVINHPIGDASHLGANVSEIQSVFGSSHQLEVGRQPCVDGCLVGLQELSPSKPHSLHNRVYFCKA